MYHEEFSGLLDDVTAAPLTPMHDPLAGTGRPQDESSAPSVWTQAARLFDSWRRGETAALDDLVRVLSPVLWHVVRAYGLDQHRAEDVVQSTWLTLVRRHESIAEVQSVGAWLMTTARREAWRVAKAESRAMPTDDEVLDRRTPKEHSAESEAVRHDEEDRLWSCVHTLSERCQRLLRIVAFDDRPDYAGIARDLDMPIGSIGPTRGRCLAKLREALEASEGGRDV